MKSNKPPLNKRDAFLIFLILFALGVSRARFIDDESWRTSLSEGLIGGAILTMILLVLSLIIKDDEPEVADGSKDENSTDG